MTDLNSTPNDLATIVLKKLEHIKSSYTKPPEKILISLFETLFYTSLKTEEGQYIRVTITLIDPANPDPFPPQNIRPDRWQAVKFGNQLQFSVKNLVKLCKAADTWSSSLAVYYNEKGEVFIWGMIDQAIHYQSYLNHEVDTGPEQPGLFQSTITGIGSVVVIMDYELIASLKHNILVSNFIDVFRRGLIAERMKEISKSLQKEIERFIADKHPGEFGTYWDDYIENIIVDSLVRILLRIQTYQHGGALLIENKRSQKVNIKYKINYTRFRSALINLIKQSISLSDYSNQIHGDFVETEEYDMPVFLYLNESVANSDKDDTRNELKGSVRFISSLSCVDGLILMDSDLNINGFGTVIKDTRLPKHIYISPTSIVNSATLIATSPNNFGTRHQSMFAYCWNNEGSLGFVISQDGDLRVIMKVENRLIVWENIRVQKFSKSKKLKKSAVKKAAKKK